MLVGIGVGGGYHGNGRRFEIGIMSLHDIPIGTQIVGIERAHVGAESFGVLDVPYGERVVVAADEKNGVLVDARQNVHRIVAAYGSASAIVVVPCLSCHLERNEDAGGERYSGSDAPCMDFPFFVDFSQRFAYQSIQPYYAEPDPNGKSIERAGERIVALACLAGDLIQV